MTPTKLLILTIVLLILTLCVVSNLCNADTIIPGCNGKVTGPVPIHSLYPGASSGIYTCLHDLDNDGIIDIALLYVFNRSDNRYELINAMRLFDYYRILDKERELNGQ